MTTREIEARITGLREGEGIRLDGVDVHHDHDSWWVQAGGGCTFHRTPRRAAEATRRLMTHLAELDPYDRTGIDE